VICNKASQTTVVPIGQAAEKGFYKSKTFLRDLWSLLKIMKFF